MELPDFISNLMKEKEDIESEISRLGEVLHVNNIDMFESLVDAEGYPRTDLSVYEVRHARASIIKLQNDYKAVNKKIEEALERYHAQDLPEFKDKSCRASRIKEGKYTPLAMLSTVSPGSPAEYAGLQEGDIILEFGHICGENFKTLQDIAEVAKSSVNLYIKVVVKRGDNVVRVNLKPQKWSGNGLIGCNIVPL